QLLQLRRIGLAQAGGVQLDLREQLAVAGLLQRATGVQVAGAAAREGAGVDLALDRHAPVALPDRLVAVHALRSPRRRLFGIRVAHLRPAAARRLGRARDRRVDLGPVWNVARVRVEHRLQDRA